MATSSDSIKTDFLRFSAYSFKDLLTRKFSESTKFTDQVYEGSNLAILIDLCSYLYQGLTYCINTAAAESMFSDTQWYENISRLVKLIGYNPQGFVPSTCEFTFTVGDGVLIPRYTAVDTGLTDSQGKKVYYSFVKDYTTGNSTNVVKLYNGIWKLYSTIFTANGSNYETFTLDGIKSDVDSNNFVANSYIHVYVKRNDVFLEFKGLTDEIFMNASTKFSDKTGAMSIYKNTDDDRYYSIRLNEDKTYEIKFGNDNNGQKLQADDKIYVFYLDCNGKEATLNIGDVAAKSFKLGNEVLGLTDDMYFMNILGITNVNLVNTIKDSVSGINDIINTTASTTAQYEETVEDIRNNAPNYYKLGNRLITKSDFEYYVKNRYPDNIIAVKCQNNWDYISTFYGWLYRLGKFGNRTTIETSVVKPHAANTGYYIEYAKLSKYDYFYADPADQNNVYLWIEMQNNTEKWKETLDEDLTPIKLMTAEVVFVDPIEVMFAICAAPISKALEYIDTQTTFDSNNESYLEITVTDNSMYSNTSIKTQINTIFNEYFDKTKMKLGQCIYSSDLETSIYAINGVTNIRTVFSSDERDSDGNKVYNDKFVNGISLACWSTSLIDIGDDLDISTTNHTLEDFQFPVWNTNDMTDKIKIIKRSFSNNSTVQY